MLKFIHILKMITDIGILHTSTKTVANLIFFENLPNSTKDAIIHGFTVRLSDLNQASGNFKAITMSKQGSAMKYTL